MITFWFAHRSNGRPVGQDIVVDAENTREAFDIARRDARVRERDQLILHAMSTHRELLA